MSDPVVETRFGHLRGATDGRVSIFKGVPYAASTAGANRFMPPQKVQAWTGVRDAFEYGGRAPQFVGGEPAEMLPTDPREAQSEDCLVLNVWTPALGRGKRAVMLWLHGGGFANGSGSYSIYAGKELARKHAPEAIKTLADIAQKGTPGARVGVGGLVGLAGRGGYAEFICVNVRWVRSSNASGR